MSLLTKILRRIFYARRIDTDRIKGKLEQLDNKMQILQNAICDNNGLGKLNLMLHNAHIPKQYYDIFYKMFAHKTGGRG